jgi:hypothetical protein
MYISPLYHQDLPWTSNNLCDKRYCFVQLTSERKLSFLQLLQFLAVNSTYFVGAADIRNCISFEKTASARFFSQLQSINNRVGLLPPGNIVTDIHVNQSKRYNFFDYSYNYFVFVTKGDFQNSATRVRACLFIRKLFPLFSEPYTLLSPHPKTPFFEWKSPAKECYYAEIDCYLTSNNFNSNLQVVCNGVGAEIVRRLSFLIARAHIARHHYGVHVANIALETPHKRAQNHLAVARLRQKNCNLVVATEQDPEADWMASSPMELNPILSTNYAFWSKVLALSYRTDFTI